MFYKKGLHEIRRKTSISESLLIKLQGWGQQINFGWLFLLFCKECRCSLTPADIKIFINPNVSLEVTINFRIPHKLSIHTDRLLLPQNNCKFELRSRWSEAYLCISACPILSQVAKSKLFVQASNLRLVLFTFAAEGSGLWYTLIRITRNPGKIPLPSPFFIEWGVHFACT